MKDGSNRFKVDENGFTADGYRRLEPESRKSNYVSSIIALIIIAAVFVSVGVYVSDDYPFVSWGMYALTVILAVYLLASPEVMYRRYRYRIDEDKLEVRKGVIFITHEMVPIERIHQVDVKEGPINRIFGLANLEITTAGGIVTVEFLKTDVAESIASKLNDKVVAILKERV